MMPIKIARIIKTTEIANHDISVKDELFFAELLAGVPVPRAGVLVFILVGVELPLATGVFTPEAVGEAGGLGKLKFAA
jgi:hypothetical protein